MEAGN